MEVRFRSSHKNTKHTDTAQYKNITWVLSQNCYRVPTIELCCLVCAVSTERALCCEM